MRLNEVIAFVNGLGLTCDIEHKAHGWTRLYLQLPRGNDLSLQFARLMFQHGRYKWAHWYIGQSGEIIPLHFYQFATELYIRTGRELDAAGFSELKFQAEEMADAEYSRKLAQREDGKKRRPLSDRNCVKYLAEYIAAFDSVLYNEVESEVIGRPIYRRKLYAKLVQHLAKQIFSSSGLQTLRNLPDL